MRYITIGSRSSALALAQTQLIKAGLEVICPDCQVTVKELQTRGDQILDRPLAELGGKGLFIKELEQALLVGEIDLAVHSLKDMPGELPDGLIIGAVSKREDARDVLISPYGSLDSLPVNSRIGTGSLRRKAQLLAVRPDLQVVPLRGNIDTRLRKLMMEDLAGIILAAAGLHRMGWTEQISQYLDPAIFVPAVGQGALALEIRSADRELLALIKQLNDADTCDAVSAERGFLQQIAGSCQVPVGAYARCTGSMLHITGFIGSLDGQQWVKKDLAGERHLAPALGKELASQILAGGGEAILTGLTQELML